jgi:5-methylcytosine-specific restriction protein A
MPSIPKFTKCTALACKAEKVAGAAYCETHGGKPKIKAERREANAPYKTAAWESIRARQLSIQPLCQSCLLDKRVTVAAHVDHVIPWRAIGERAFIHNRFQSLCNACHSVKTGHEARGVFFHYTDTGAIEYTAADYGYILTT